MQFPCNRFLNRKYCQSIVNVGRYHEVSLGIVDVHFSTGHGKQEVLTIWRPLKL